MLAIFLRSSHLIYFIIQIRMNVLPLRYVHVLTCKVEYSATPNGRWKVKVEYRASEGQDHKILFQGQVMLCLTE